MKSSISRVVISGVLILLAVVGVVALIVTRTSTSTKNQASEPIQEVEPSSSDNQCTCHVRLTSFLVEDQVQNQRKGTHQFECAATDKTFLLDMDLKDAVYVRNQDAFAADKWFIRFPCEWVDDDGKLPRERNDQIESLTMDQVRTGDPATRRNLRTSSSNTSVERRRRLSNIGKQYVGIVIVHAADKTNPMSATEAESMLNKANAQFKDCSGNDMELVKQDNTVSITLPKRIGAYTSGNVDSDMMMMICRKYGYSDGCEISKERDLDHILFSLPHGLSDDNTGAFWAKGSAGDSRRFSVYSGGNYNFEGGTFDGGFFVPSTIMHELGHNYRLGHALDPRNNGNSAYGDSTIHMGGGANTKKCFSGYNYFVLGWHQSQTNQVSLSPNVAKKYNLRSIDDLSSGGIVNIKADKYYVTLNLKKGINSETGEYGNKVVIHEGDYIHFGQSISAAYHDTRLVADLGQSGDRFEAQVSNGKLRIELCSMDTQGSGGAMLSIGLEKTDCGSNGPVHTPDGMKYLMSGVPVTGLSGDKNDVLEYMMEFSSVPDSVTCSTSGGSGDVDLLINSMSTPQVLYSTNVNSCYSRGTTTSQSCTADNLKGRFVYVTVEGDDPFGGVKLECTATGANSVQGSISSNTSSNQDSNQDNDNNSSPSSNQDNDNNSSQGDDKEENEPVSSDALQSGVAKKNINLLIGRTRYYTMRMPSNAKSIRCFISGGVGDADLYARWDAKVDVTRRSANACAPWVNGNEEECDAGHLTPLGNVLHVGVHAYKDFEGVSLECDIN